MIYQNLINLMYLQFLFCLVIVRSMYQDLLLWWNYTRATRLGVRMKVHMRSDVGITTSSQSHTNVAETLCETLFVCVILWWTMLIAPSREVPNSFFFANIEDEDLLQYFDSRNGAINPGKCDQWYNHLCVWSVYVCLVSFNGVMTCLGIPHTPDNNWHDEEQQLSRGMFIPPNHRAVV